MDYIAVFCGSVRVEEDAWIPGTSLQIITAESDEEAMNKAKAKLRPGSLDEHLLQLYALSHEVNLGKWRLRAGIFSDAKGETFPEEYETMQAAAIAARTWKARHEPRFTGLGLYYLRPDGTLEFCYEQAAA